MAHVTVTVGLSMHNNQSFATAFFPFLLCAQCVHWAFALACMPGELPRRFMSIY